MSVRISDHALVRFLERAGAVDFDPLRQALAQGLARGLGAARKMGSGEVHIVMDGLVYVVRDDMLVTVRPVRGR